jgi:actin-related protein
MFIKRTLITTLLRVTSELLFELYSVPSAAYAVDAVMSFYHDNPPSSSHRFEGDGLVLSFNTASTSVVPVLGGRGIMSHSKRSEIYYIFLPFTIHVSRQDFLGRFSGI